MLKTYTAKYTKISSGYMGQIIEFPEVITEGKDIEECRAMLKDALHEMTLAYQELGKELPIITRQQIAGLFSIVPTGLPR